MTAAYTGTLPLPPGRYVPYEVMAFVMVRLYSAEAT